jgi:hypothetical protein
MKYDVGSRRREHITFTHDRHDGGTAPGAAVGLSHGLVEDGAE